MSDIEIGDTFRYQGASVAVVAVGGPKDAFPVRDGEIGIRAMSSADGLHLGWIPVTSGEYEAFRDLAEFLEVAEPTDVPQDHGPLAAVLSDRTLAKVLSRPAHVPSGTDPDPFSVEGMVITSGWLAEQVGECTCGGVDQYGHECHEPGCGLEPVARLDDLPGWPRTSRPTTDEAVAAIKKRLQWASIHWGTKGVSEDAWPHIADAVLSLWGPEKAS